MSRKYRTLNFIIKNLTEIINKKMYTEKRIQCYKKYGNDISFLNIYIILKIFIIVILLM